MINQEQIAFYTTLFYVWSIFGLFITHVTLSGIQYYYIKNLILKEAFYKNEEFLKKLCYQL